MNIQVDQFRKNTDKKNKRGSSPEKIIQKKGNLMRIFKTIQEVSNEISKNNTTDRRTKMDDAQLANDLYQIKNDIESLDITSNLSEIRNQNFENEFEFNENMILQFGDDYKNKESDGKLPDTIKPKFEFFSRTDNTESNLEWQVNNILEGHDSKK